MDLCTDCTLPEWGSSGLIKRKTEVMGLKNGAIDKGTEVVWQDPSQPPSDTQKWLRSLPDTDGMFTLTNLASEKLLHSEEENKFTIGKKDVTTVITTNPPPATTTQPLPPDSNIRINKSF